MTFEGLRRTKSGGAEKRGIQVNRIFPSLIRLDGYNATVVAHAVDYCLAALSRTRSLKLKIHVRIIYDTQKKQLVSRMIAEK
jgi:hypothetical protein